MKKISLKICGITSSKSIKIAAQNNIQNLGFASNNLPGPNTCNDSKIKKLIKECDLYEISSVLLTRHQSLENLVKQIDFTKPKTISCSYFFKKEELISIKSIFAPQYSAQFAEATKLIPEVQTKSPILIPNANKVACKAEVALLSALQ